MLLVAIFVSREEMRRLFSRNLCVPRRELLRRASCDFLNSWTRCAMAVVMAMTWMTALNFDSLVNTIAKMKQSSPTVDV
jgi:hypothetical protein